MIIWLRIPVFLSFIRLKVNSSWLLLMETIYVKYFYKSMWDDIIKCKCATFGLRTDYFIGKGLATPRQCGLTSIYLQFREEVRPENESNACSVSISCFCVVMHQLFRDFVFGISHPITHPTLYCSQCEILCLNSRAESDLISVSFPATVTEI